MLSPLDVLREHLLLTGGSKKDVTTANVELAPCWQWRAASTFVDG
jgi:hypothetical protein